MEDQPRNSVISMNGILTPQNKIINDTDEYPSADSGPSRLVDRELRVSLEENSIPLNSTSQFGLPPAEQATQAQSKGPKLSQRLSGLCPHSTPNVIRAAPTRGLERIRARHQANQEEEKVQSRSNTGIVQQDLAGPIEAQTQDHNRRFDGLAVLNTSLDESFTGFGSASSTQLIQLYRTGLNMRPNTPTGPSQNSAIRNNVNQYSYLNNIQEDSPLGRPQQLPQRLLVSQLRSHKSNLGDAANQPYLSIQERKIQQPYGTGLLMSHPLAPFGTQSQSTQDLPTIDQNIHTNVSRGPVLAGVKEFLTANNDAILRNSPQSVPIETNQSGIPPICHEVTADRISEVQLEVDDGSKAEELSLNAPINTVARSPPSLGSPIREVNNAMPIINQRLNPVPHGPCASRLQNFSENHSHGIVSAIHTRQLHTQNQSSVLPSCLPELNQNPQIQPSIISQIADIPDMPPNTNNGYVTLQHSDIGGGGSPLGNQNSNEQDQASADIEGQSAFAITQTNGYLTTMAQSSQQDIQSQVTLSGAAGLRPQNLFHRDEMFQIYLQRPPPPSPLRNRIRSQIDSQSSELAMQAQRISSPINNSQNSQEPLGVWAPLQPGLIQAQGQVFSPADSSILDGDLIDEVDRIALAAHQNVNQGIQSRGSMKSQPNVPAQHSSGSSSVITGQQLNVTREEEGSGNNTLLQSQPRNRTLQNASPEQHLGQIQPGSPGVTRVYHEVIENQHRSNQQTLRGLERVAVENEALRTRVLELEREKIEMQKQVESMQRVMIEHSRRCPMLGRLSVSSRSPSESLDQHYNAQQVIGACGHNQPILRLSSNRPLPQGKSDRESEESKE